jgi:hypothetical protein
MRVVRQEQKKTTSGLTRLRKSRAVEARDPDVYHLGWRLRTVQQDLWALRAIAERNRHRWPRMEEELHEVSVTVLCHMAKVQVAHDWTSADIV